MTKTKSAGWPQVPDQAEPRTRWGIIGFAFLFLAALFVARTLLAQTTTGSIQGTVTDASGSVIPGVSVRCTSTATGQVATATTTGAGFYVLPLLPPGEYTVEFNAPGFERVRQEHVSVGPISAVGLDMTLKIGPTTAEVTVTSAPPPLDTENGTLDATIPAETYEALPAPLNNAPKSPFYFATLLPTAGTAFSGDQITLTGGVAGATILYLNGMQVINPVLAGDERNINYNTNPEDVSSFQAILTGIPAYYTGQGVINLVSKSGTNEIHGDVYENIRNTVFDAPGVFSLGVVPVDHQNEYGVSVGGPILKNRLFAFFNTDRFDLTNGATPGFATIPTTAELTGDFSQSGFAPIYDPTTTYTNGDGTITRCQFGQTPTVAGGFETCSGSATNVIPSGRISSISQVLESAWPTPSNGQISNNYLSSLTSGQISRQYTGRLDATINDRNHGYFLVQEGYLSYTGAQGSVLPANIGSAPTSSNEAWGIQIGETWAIKPNLMNLFGVGWDRMYSPVYNSTEGTPWPSKAGLTGLPSGDNVQNAFPPLTFTGPESPSSEAGFSNHSYLDANNMLLVQDNMVWTRGRHSLTVGGVAHIAQDNGNTQNQVAFNFVNSETAGYCPASGTGYGGQQCAPGTLDGTTGNAYASYLLGLVDNANAVDNAFPSTSGRWSDYAVYAQDDWKLTPRLTLNLGLRYNVALPYHEAHDHLSWFNPTLANPAIDGFGGALQFAGNGNDSCNCSSRVQVHHLEFDPRFGFAYALNPKTVVRGSFGIYHFLGTSLSGSDLDGTGLLGYQANPNFASTDSGINPAFNWNSGFPAYQLPPFFDPTLNTGFNALSAGAPVTGGAVTYDRPATAGRMSYTETWNFTVSRELLPTLVAQISYVANASHQLTLDEASCCGGGYQSQLPLQYLTPAMAPLLNAQTTDSNWPSELAAAQALFPGIGLPYANFQGSIAQMLKPDPQYGVVGDPYAEGGDAHFEALQTSVDKKMSNGLQFMASFVWSKLIDDSEGAVLGWGNNGLRTAWNISQDRAVANSDTPYAIKALWAYSLPAGRGHLVGGQNALTDALLGGWQVSGDNTYTDGNPLGIWWGNGCDCVTGEDYGWADYNPNFTGSPRMNGKFGSGNPSDTQYLNPNAVQPPPTNGFGNTPRNMAFGIRNPWNLNEDASVTKGFRLTERFSLRLKLDAFNLFNRTVFGGINTYGPNAPGGFGYVTSQTNSPRKLQFETYIKF
jgi:Carboxypeptidase regulatory-like domain